MFALEEPLIESFLKDEKNVGQLLDYLVAAVAMVFFRNPYGPYEQTVVLLDS